MYFTELEHLKNSLKNKLSLTEENDRKADLLILHNHASGGRKKKVTFDF